MTSHNKNAYYIGRDIQRLILETVCKSRHLKLNLIYIFVKIRDLTQEDILCIRDRITNETTLEQLALRLKVESHEVDSAKSNNSGNIKGAALAVIKIWRQSMETPRKAFINMYVALCEAGLASVANDVLGQQKKETEEEHNESAPLDDVTQRTDNESAPLDDVTQRTDNESAPLDDVTQRTDNESAPLEDLTQRTDNESAPLDDLTQWTDNESAPLEDLTQRTEPEPGRPQHENEAYKSN